MISKKIKSLRKFYSVVLIFFLMFLIGCSDTIADGVNCVELHQGYNSIDIPYGKELYILTANIPSTYNNRTAETYFFISATDYQSDRNFSKSLIPSSAEIDTVGGIINALKTTRSNVCYFMIDLDGNNRPCTTDMQYLCMGEEVVYYVQVGIDDGVDYSEFASYLDKAICDSDGKCYLNAERQLLGLNGYDVDGTGYFHIVFTDFGEDSVTESGGVAGAYDPTQIRMQNKADMFYVNTRYVNLINRILTSESDISRDILARYSSYEDCIYTNLANNVVRTLLHEYCHCLMDCNRYQKKKLSLRGSLFWIEGTANLVPYWLTGALVDKAAVKEWIGLSEDYNPNLTADDRTMEYDYATYGAGPLFFGFIGNRYGNDTLKKFIHYSENSNENIRTIVGDCTGEPFETVYRAFLMEMISSCGCNVRLENSKGNVQFGKKWGFTLRNLETGSGIYVCDENDNLISKGDKFISQSRANYSGSLHQLGWSLTKWEGRPSSLFLSGDILCYAMFI